MAGWQHMKAQPLAMGLGHCFCASDLKSLLFSMLVKVKKKGGGGGRRLVSLRKRNGFLIPWPPFFISALQM